MARDPHDDLDAVKLELSLRESNLEVHKTEMDRAEEFLANAQKALHDIPWQDQPDPLSAAMAYSTLAGSIAQVRMTRLHLEMEQAQVEHERAHVEHAEAEAAGGDKIRDVLQRATEGIAQQLRDAGIDAQSLDGLPFPGIILKRPDAEDDRPNT